MGVLSVLYTIFSTLFVVISFLLLTTLLIMHVYSYFKRAKPVKLNSDSVVIIVGGCMGIGKLMALEIARQYHPTIFLVDRKKQLFQAVSKQIKSYNSVCQCFMCDLSDLEAVKKLLESIKKQTKKVDLLIYNAGVMIPTYSWEASHEQLNTVMNVNFFAPIRIINDLLPRLQGGHIALVASVVSIIDGATQLSSYVSSKHAIYGYMNTLRMELRKARKNITVSIGCPYAINTTMFHGFKTKYQKFLPTLDENYVAERLVRQFIAKKQICFVGRRHAFIAKITQFLPTFVIDWITINTNVSNFQNQKKNL